MLGPNVEGFVNYIDQVAPYGTTPPADPVKGSISVISQSGTVAWTMNQMASDRAVGLRIILGVGNEAVSATAAKAHFGDATALFTSVLFVTYLASLGLPVALDDRDALICLGKRRDLVRPERGRGEIGRAHV